MFNHNLEFVRWQRESGVLLQYVWRSLALKFQDSIDDLPWSEDLAWKPYFLIFLVKGPTGCP
jgi:hypothetical protein